MLPNFIMTVGIPGSGKSSWIKSLNKYIIVNPDSIRKELSGDISNQDVNNQAWILAKERTVAALIAGLDVILDATNVSTRHRRIFIKGLPPCNLKAKVFDVKPMIAYGRIANDIRLGVDRSNVPEKVVYRMYGEFIYTKKVLAQEGFKLIL